MLLGSSRPNFWIILDEMDVKMMMTLTAFSKTDVEYFLDLINSHCIILKISIYFTENRIKMNGTDM